MKMNMTMDPQNKTKTKQNKQTNKKPNQTNKQKRRADRTIRTKTMNWPRFLLVESGDESLPVTKLSPFAIDKDFQTLISGRLRSTQKWNLLGGV